MPIPSAKPIDKALTDALGVEQTTTEPARDIDNETIKPRLHHTDAGDKVIAPRPDGEIKQILDKTPDVYHSAMMIVFQETRILNPTRPQKSWYIPSSRMMFYIIHEMNKLMVTTKQFIENAGPYHPIVITLGYSVIFCIQVLRCQRAANDLNVKQRDLLDKFLDQFPLNVLPIPGPLVSYFQSITNSQPPIRKMGMVYPKLPDSSYYERYFYDEEEVKNDAQLNDYQGYPRLSQHNWYIPNIPLQLGVAHYLTTNAALQTLADGNNIPAVLDYFTPQSHNNVNIRPEILGSPWPASSPARHQRLYWTLTTPGFEYRCPAKKHINQNFISTGQDLQFPQYDRDFNFEDIDEYLGFDSGFQWFGNILPILNDFCAYFKCSTTLANCPVDASASNQIIITYMKKDGRLVQPSSLGDQRGYLPLAFTAATISTITGRTDELQAFLSQLNVDYPSQLSAALALEGGFTNASIRSGPFWNSSTVEFKTLEDHNYLLVPTIIRKHFHVTKPEN